MLYQPSSEQHSSLFGWLKLAMFMMLLALGTHAFALNAASQHLPTTGDSDLPPTSATIDMGNRSALLPRMSGHGFFVDSGQSLGDSNSLSVAVGDVDGDGDLDAVVGNYNEGNKVWINNGSGNFIDSGQSLGNLSGHAIVMGDLDRDGDLDVFAGNWHTQPDKVWLNDGTGNFTDSGQTLGNNGTITVALGDVDGDGDLDAFVGNADISGGGVSNQVWLNDGAGNFTDGGQSLGNSDSVAVLLSDLDSDGDLDAFVGNTRLQANTVWINDGTGRFTDSGQTLGNSSSYSVASGDVDSDGDLDLFVGNQGDNNANRIWLNDGTGSFTDSAQTLGSATSRAASLADLDGDGDLDVFVANQDGANKVWLNDGAGHFTDTGQKLGSSGSRGLGLGDLDGDGDLDAFVGNDNQRNKVWLNKEKCPANQICNGGFEQGVEYWNYSGEMEIVSPGHTDNNAIHSFQERTSAQSASWAGIRQELQVVPGQSYDYTFWLKSENAAGGHFKFIWFNAANEEIGTSYSVRGISGDLDWTQFDGQVTAPLAATKAEMILWHGVSQSVNVPGSTVWVDDVVVTATPNVVAIYAFAFDNPPTSTYGLAYNFPEAMQSIVDATASTPDKMAIVLVDLEEEGDTHIRVVRNGAETLIAGLPDTSGELSLALDEYDMADGATLGGFIKWSLDHYTHQNSKTIFSFVGHGSALTPETDDRLFPEHSRAYLPSAIPMPACYDVNSAFTDSHPRSTLSPYDLASALEFATNAGEDPIDVLDLVQCFSASIEQFYELSNPDGLPYAATISGAPNFAYLNPKMLGAALSATQPSDDAATLASTLLESYNTVLAEDDEEPSQHPRLLVAMDSSKIADIKTAWDNMSHLVADALINDREATKEKILNAYLASAKYDTTFCEGDFRLDAPDALVDMVDFAYRLSDEFGPLSGAGTWAEITKLGVEDAIIAKHFTNGQPWFANRENSETPPTWNFDAHYGMALYADFMGMTSDDHPDTIMLNWQAHWYTDEVSPENLQPYAFVQDTRWDEVIQGFWQGQTTSTMACLSPLPPALRDGEVSADQVLFPLRGTTTQNSPVSPAVVISVNAPETPLSPLVEFEVTQDNQVVFSDTVSAGTVATGTYQVDASRSWQPDTTAPFTLTITVDADNRVKEANENDNQIILKDRVFASLSSPRPVIDAGVKDGVQEVSNKEVKLALTQEADTIEAPVGTLAVQLYQYEAGENPNTYVPLKRSQQNFRNISLPLSSFPLTLPDDTMPGPVVLHVWALSRGGLTPQPQVIHFNYAPASTTIGAGEEQHFTYRVRKGERLQLDLDLLDGGDANLFVWDPLNYGRPIWQGTNVGDDTIIIDPAPTSGKYIVEVYGETNATYTLTRNSSPSGRMAEQAITNANPDAYVPEARPTFFEPIPGVPDVPAEVEIEVDNADTDHVSITGSWESSTGTSGYVGSDYLHDDNEGKGSKRVRFTPPITDACTYQVELNWTAEANRATNVPVQIKHADGTDSVTVNQQEHGGEWNVLGSYNFNADGSEYVELRTDGTNGHVIADAVRFVAFDCSPLTSLMSTNPLSDTIMLSEVITVEIEIDNVTDLYGAQVEFAFDPTMLEVVDAYDYEPGIQLEHGDLLVPDTTIRNNVDNQNGTIEYAISLQGDKPGITGSGTLARIHFRAIGAGTSPISVTNALLSTPDAESIRVISSNGDVNVFEVEELSVSGSVQLEDQSDHTGTDVCADADIEDNCVTTGADGSYLLEHLPLTGTISFSHQDYLTDSLSYEGTIGQQLVLTDVTLIKKQLTVTGKVTLEHRDSHLGTLVCNMETVCVTTSANGSYTLENMPLTGTVTFKHSGYLSQTLPYEGEPREVITLPDVELTVGDLSGNGKIDIDDATIIGHAWNSQPGDANWNARADLNGDGVVNIFDMVIIQRNWGQASIESRNASRGATVRQPVNSDTVVLISPANAQLEGEGESVEMHIQVEQVNNLYGGSLTVTFDPSLLQVRDINPNETGIQIRSGDFLDANNQLIVINRVDNENGIIEFAVTQTYPAEAKSGNGTLATITFDSIKEGQSHISLTDVRLVDHSTPDPQVIGVTTEDAEVQVGEPKQPTLYLPLMMSQ